MVVLLIVAGALPGCTSNAPVASMVPTWELARAEPIAPTFIDRCRISFDRPLPPHLVQELNSQFSLISIRTSRDWAETRRRLSLENTPAHFDFDRGIIVGIQANVGESAQNGWPIHIQKVRTTAGEGWLDVSFAAGVYYPLQTAGYLELAYVPGLHTVTHVSINRLEFMIRPKP